MNLIWNQITDDSWESDLGFIKLFCFKKEEDYISFIQGIRTIRKKPCPTLKEAQKAVETSLEQRLKNFLGLKDERVVPLKKQFLKVKKQPLSKTLKSLKPGKMTVVYDILQQYNEGLVVSALAEKCQTSTNQISAILSKLEKFGMVEKIPLEDRPELEGRGRGMKSKYIFVAAVRNASA